MKILWGLILVWPAMVFSAVSLSFVETAAAVQVTANGGYHEYRMVLQGVDPYITYYTQRPNSTSGLAALPDFVKAWKVGQNNFQDNPPTAVLYGGIINQTPNKSHNFYIFQLSSPELDLANHQVSYIAKWIGGSKMLFQNMVLNYAVLVIN